MNARSLRRRIARESRHRPHLFTSQFAYTPEGEAVMREVFDITLRGQLKTIDELGGCTPQTAATVRLDAVRGTEKLQRLRGNPDIACQAGCAWCCYLNVHASPLEVSVIVHYLTDHYDEATLAAVRERVAEHAQAQAGMSLKERQGLRRPCPLLQDNRCMVYEVRPMKCCAWNSMDAKQCERFVTVRDEKPVTVNVDRVRIAETIWRGERESLEPAQRSSRRRPRSRGPTPRGVEP